MKRVETLDAMNELCQRFGEAWDAEQVDKLLLIDAFVLDFLCIHLPTATAAWPGC
jgi:hypothetical protein